MKLKYSPVLTSLALASYCLGLAPAWAQLPPTNMGKFVKQPGDNQYTPATQMTRHGTSYCDTGGGEKVYYNGAPAAGGGGGGGRPMAAMPLLTPPPRGPDVSIEAITAEEPIPPSGFPPLPRNLDLPFQPGLSASAGGGSGWTSPPPQAGGGGGPSGPIGMHQHYAHYQPGAFKAGGTTPPAAPGAPPGGYYGGGPGMGADPSVGASGGGGYGSGSGYYKVRTPDAPQPQSMPVSMPSSMAPDPSVGASGGGGGSSNYYKCRTPPPLGRAMDTFSANTSDPTRRQADGAPTFKGTGGDALKALGKAPGLDGDSTVAGSPETPIPVMVNQSTTQDMSLPDDEFSSRNFKDQKVKRFIKQTAKRGKQMGRQMMRQSGVPISF